MVLAIAVSGVGLAQSRAMAPAVGEAVLCFANGPVTIYIDASGQPTSPPEGNDSYWARIFLFLVRRLNAQGVPVEAALAIVLEIRWLGPGLGSRWPP